MITKAAPIEADPATASNSTQKRSSLSIHAQTRGSLCPYKPDAFSGRMKTPCTFDAIDSRSNGNKYNLRQQQLCNAFFVRASFTVQNCSNNFKHCTFECVFSECQHMSCAHNSARIAAAAGNTNKVVAFTKTLPAQVLFVSTTTLTTLRVCFSFFCEWCQFVICNCWCCFVDA